MCAKITHVTIKMMKKNLTEIGKKSLYYIETNMVLKIIVASPVVNVISLPSLTYPLEFFKLI